MAKPRTKALVVFEDGQPDSERVGRAIAERLDLERYDVIVMKASALDVSDLLAAGLYFFGAESPEPAPYAELARTLKGINLAGRRAAFFGATGAAVAWLRTMCIDSELGTAHADLIGRRPEGSALVAWLRGIAP